MTAEALFPHLAALGVWPALPLTGFWALRATGSWAVLGAEPLAARLALASAVGVAVWSIPMLAATFPGWYSGVVFGILGWLVTIATLVWLIVRRRELGLGDLARGEWRPAELLVVAGLLAAGIFYAVFPAESIQGGRDQGTYAMHGVYIAHHGQRDVPYPFDASAREVVGEAYIRPSGTYATTPAMTVQGGQVFPVWLAQAFSTGGHIGLFRLNAAFAVLALGVFYGLCRAFVPTGLAALATAFLAVNPSQVWLARTTLTEILTQLLVVGGLLFLVRALSVRDAATARWAGLLFGLSALVRIDSFLFLALLFAAHAAWRIANRDHRRDERIWLAMYQTAVPLFVASLAFYAFFGGSYFGDLADEVRPIVAAAIVGFVLLLVMQPRIADRARPIVLGVPARALAAMALVGGALFAYFVRPTLAPFDLIEWPGNPLDGTRSYVEEAFFNLGVYLSPAILWVAVLGAVLAVLLVADDRSAVRLPRLLIVPLVLIAGFAVPYSWDPKVAPDHFWAIRRFVPIAIPGLLLLAGIGVWWILDRVPQTVRLVAGIATVWFVVGHATTAIAPVAAVSEYRGYYADLHALASRLPADQVVIGHGNTTWASPLYVAFDRRLVRLDLDSGVGKAAFERWAERQFALGQPVYLAYQRAPDLVGLRAERRYAGVLASDRIEMTVRPLPRELVRSRVVVSVFRISGLERPLDYDGVDLVRAFVWKAREEGVYPRTSIEGETARWTDGHARFVVPIDGASGPTRLLLSTSSSAPGGSRLRVVVNKVELWAGSVSSAATEQTLDLTRAPTRDGNLEIELLSDTVNEEAGGTSRPLGVAVRRLELQRGTASTAPTRRAV